MPDDIDRYTNNPLDGPAQFKDMLTGLTRRIAELERAIGAGLPVSTVIAIAGSTLPTGFLWCNGDAIPAEHIALIAEVGPNTPDLRDRVPVGLGNMGGASDAGLVTATLTPGTEFGEATHTLTAAESGIPYGMSNIGSASGTIGAVRNLQSPGLNASSAHNNVQPSTYCNFIIKY